MDTENRLVVIRGEEGWGMGKKGKRGIDCMVTESNQTYCGDHFVVCTSIKLLYCTPEINMLYTDFTSVKKSLFFQPR